MGVNILVYILLFSINLHFILVNFFVNYCVMVFVVSFFFTKCTVLNGDSAKWRIIVSYIDKMTSMVILVFSMVKGSIPEVEFISISRGKKLI